MVRFLMFPILKDVWKKWVCVSRYIFNPELIFSFFDFIGTVKSVRTVSVEFEVGDKYIFFVTPGLLKIIYMLLYPLLHLMGF